MDNGKNITQVAIEEEMRKSYLDYAMSVIVSRALPDVRDGLKPVHRRIIYAMDETGNHHNKPHRKSARVVGEVMGKYHPHGDAAIYDAMVRLAQDFSLRVPLIDGQGNFGSMDGDPAAAPRYTEARMGLAAHELVKDIEFGTVDFIPNYDNTDEEPVVLPARFPNLLVNGAGGIAVGMATNIPSHNLGEVIDACCAFIDNPEMTTDEFMTYIHGPDFPTGGSIIGSCGIREAFETGRGSVIVRAKTKFETRQTEKESIIITEIPYQVNKAKLVEKIAELVKGKIVEGISDIRDESNKDGVRVVIDLKKDSSPDIILNKLFKYTQMQIFFGYNMLALVKNRPVRLSIKEIVRNFIDFRYDIIVRRSKFNLKKNRERSRILMGFAVSIANIDVVIDIIRSSRDRNEAKNRLIQMDFDANSIIPFLRIVEGQEYSAEKYQLTEQQINAILDLRLHRLTGLEREKIKNDLQNVVNEISNLVELLGSREKIFDVMKEEFKEIKDRFYTTRLTSIEEEQEDMDDEDFIVHEDMVVTITLGGYIKRVPLSVYREQKRGGKGRSGMHTKEEDLVQSIYVANTHDDVLFFTSIGRVYKLKVYKLSLETPASKGRSIANIFPLENGEMISTILVLTNDQRSDSGNTLIFATSHGIVRRSKLQDFLRINASGKFAIRLEDGEKLVGVSVCGVKNDILLSTRNGNSNRFSVDKLRIFASRNSNGVRGIKLKNGDDVISMAILEPWDVLSLEEREGYIREATKYRLAAKRFSDDGNTGRMVLEDRMLNLALAETFIMTITQNGFGKITSCYEFKATGRGTQGVISIIINSKNGKVVSSSPVSISGNFILITSKGKLIRIPIKDIRITRRTSMGVIIVRLEEGEFVTSVSVIDDKSEQDKDGEVQNV